MACKGGHTLLPVIAGGTLFAVYEVAVNMTSDNDPSRIIDVRSATAPNHGFTDKGVAVLNNGHGIGIA